MRFGDLGLFFRRTLAHLSPWLLDRTARALAALLVRPGARGWEWLRSARLGTEPLLRRIQRPIVAQQMARVKLPQPLVLAPVDLSRLRLRAGQLGLALGLVAVVWLGWPQAPESSPLEPARAVDAPPAPAEEAAGASAHPAAAVVPGPQAQIAVGPRARPPDQRTSGVSPGPGRRIRSGARAVAELAAPAPDARWIPLEVPALIPEPGSPRAELSMDGQSLLRLRLKALSALARAQASRVQKAEEAPVLSSSPAEAPPEPSTVLGQPKALSASRAPVAWAPLPRPTPVPSAPAVRAGPLWSDHTPDPTRDHLWLASPFLPEFNRIYSGSYAFGSTAGGRYRVHHGLDIPNPMGTPIRAGVTGQVVHAGRDMPTLLGPYSNFYGNAVVIRLDRRLSTSEGEKEIYVLYGHMSAVYAQVGQSVTPEDVVGAVGMEGIAIGPHLHVEVRVAENSYATTVNPILWMEPPPGTGVVALRVVDRQGRAWPGVRVGLVRYVDGQGQWYRSVETYAVEEPLQPDPIWGENAALGHVPPGTYAVTATINGEKVTRRIQVEAGRTTFVELRTTQ